MERDDSGELEREGVCLDCGAAVTPGADRSYSLGDAGALCWACALKRGGRYDADEDRWAEPPGADDLRRPWTPREP